MQLGEGIMETISSPAACVAVVAGGAQEPHEPADLNAYEWIEQSPPLQADLPAARPQDGEPGHSEQMGPTLKDVELALRVLRQARQSIIQT